MIATEKRITIRDLVKGYQDNDEEGVRAFGGDLDIRPPYQREFVYGEKERNLVIDTVKKGHPLSIMYWNTKDDGSFEVLDGQQRTISICEYVHNNFSYENKLFDRLPADAQRDILDYELLVYRCTGTESERIDWFQVINIAGLVLRKQEIRNAIYPGPWTSDAKRRFSKRNCPAKDVGKNHLSGEHLRQDYLETVLKWKCKSLKDDDINEYMNQNCKKHKDASALWKYFEEVIEWAKLVFGEDRIMLKAMRRVQWGFLYNEHGKEKLDPDKIQSRVVELFRNEAVDNKSGIYAYVLDGKEKHLNIRAFKDPEKQTVFARQGGICANKECGKVCETISEMEADHITPWSEGGKTILDNCQMLCKDCNRRKGAR